jgi:nucleotide-binding universal stress UspA family protein
VDAKQDEGYRIVVGVDFSDGAGRALAQAFAEAKMRPVEGLEIHAVVVVDDGIGLHLRRRPAELEQHLAEVRAKLTAEVSGALGRHMEAGGAPVATTVHVRVGDPVDEITSLALEESAHVVIVGSHGARGVRRPLLGSVAERVVRLAPCPVLVVRARDETAMAAVPRPEPGDLVPATGEQITPHRYAYSSVLEPPPANHML